MKAIRKETPTGELFTLVDEHGETIPNMQRFKRFVCGVGWACERQTHNYAKDWLLLVGEQEDGVPLCILERSGTRPTILREVVNIKDLFLCREFWVNASEVHELKVREMRQYEGLTYYRHETTTFGTTKWITDPATWKHFRPERPLAFVAGVPEIITADIATGFTNFDQMARSQKLLIRATCLEVNLLLKDWSNQYKQKDKVAEHPLIHAAVFALSMLLRTRPVEGKQEKPYNPYPNRRRL